MQQLLKYALIGILAFIPVVVILQIVLFVKDRFSDLFSLVYGYSDNYTITVFLFVVSFMLFAYVGYRVSSGTSWIIALIDSVIDRVPFLNSIYRITKKIVNMVSGHEQQDAREVVYVEYPREGIWVPAYVTNKSEDRYVLFVPTSPNPTSGFAVIVHESKVVKSSMTIEQATGFIISAGVDFGGLHEITQLPK